MPGGKGGGGRGQGPGRGKGKGGGQGRCVRGNGSGQCNGAGSGRRLIEGAPAVAECLCPSCGATAPHMQGRPCGERACPECGTPMRRK